jgi:hypothetical protein
MNNETKYLFKVLDGCENKSRKNHETRRGGFESKKFNGEKFSLDEFLCFEIASEIKHLPCCETKKTAHAEYTEEQYSVVG